MAVLAIAQGAVNLGKKLLGGIKKRREKKQAKQAAKNEAKNAKIASLESLLSGGGGGATTPVQQANASFISNIVDRLQSGNDVDLPVDVAADARAIRANRFSGGEGGNKNMFVMIGLGIVALFLLLGRRR